VIDKDILKNDRGVIETVLKYYGANIKERRNSDCITSRHKDAKGDLSICFKSGWVCACHCGLCGDVFKVVEIMEGITDFKDQLKKVCKICNINTDDEYKPIKKDISIKRIDKEVYDFTKIADVLHENITSTDYFKNRGFTSTIDKYKLGYHPEGLNFIINNYPGVLEEKANDLNTAYQYFIPCFSENDICNYILVRKNDNHEIPEWVKSKVNKTHNLKGYAAALFNIRYLYHPQLTEKYIFVVESWADALSLEELGYNAISLNSTSNVNIFLKKTKKNKDLLKNKVFITAGNADTAGYEMNSNITKGLKALELQFHTYIITQFNDINEFLTSDREGLEASIKDFISSLININNLVIKDSPHDEKEQKRSQADLLVELASDLKLFHDESNDPYATICVNNHNEIWSIGSKDFKRYLSKKYWDKYSKAPGNEAIRSALSTIEGQAVFNGDKHQLYNRIAEIDNSIWYDLSNNEWSVIKVNSDGWELVEKPPVLFKRYKHQSPQTIPQSGGDVRKILSFINLKGSDLLFMVYLVSCFIPGWAHPIPVIFGEKGAAKSTTFKILKKIIDPSIIEVMTFPKDQSELIQQLSHHWFIGYDNITTMPNWISDALCRACTGEGMSKRVLYTDDEDKIYSFRRCIGLNGINVVASKEDLLDRSILFELKRIISENRREESAIWREFEEASPYILGGIFDTLVNAIKLYPTVKLNKLNRLADFTRWGYAIAEGMGESGEEFIKQYTSNIEKQNKEAIASNPIATAIVILMEKNETWTGKASALLGKIEDIAFTERIDSRSNYFPKSASALTRRLNNIKSNLLDVGITFEIQHTKVGNNIVIKKA